MTYCKCRALGVDGCEFYVRLIGNEADREEIKKVREKLVVSNIEPWKLKIYQNQTSRKVRIQMLAIEKDYEKDFYNQGLMAFLIMKLLSCF